MKKTSYDINFSYTYDPARKGAKYSLNGGENWCNNGDFSEIAAKLVLGYAGSKNACGRYDMTDDIVEINASVKSSKATLVNMVLGYDYDSVKNHYFATCHSNLWIWVSHTTETVTLYYMNRNEFESFMDKWARYDKDRKVIRFKEESLVMLNWLETRAN